jgi:tetratricopeptide (TPR) repeat protein
MKPCNLPKIFLAIVILFAWCSDTFAWNPGFGPEFGKRRKEYDVQPPPSEPSGPSQEEADRALREKIKRQREQREAEEAEKAQREEAFRQKKQEALDMMKGVSEGELGLKGVGPSGGDDLGLKGVDEPSTGSPRRRAILRTPEPAGSSAVDLRHLDPDRPIVVDPNVVKGRERVFSVQVSRETLNNPSYKKGCEAFMSRDPEAALRYFRQAQKERPGDPLVRAQVLLAQDLIKVRQQEEKTQWGAYQVAFDGVHAARNGDYAGALYHFRRANEINPQDKIIARWKQNLWDLNLDLNRLEMDPGLSAQEKDREMKAMYLAGNGIVALLRGDLRTAQIVFEAAQNIEPQSKCLQVLLEGVAQKRQDLDAAKKAKNKKKMSRSN